MKKSVRIIYTHTYGVSIYLLEFKQISRACHSSPFSNLHFPHRRTHTSHQMSLASHTSTLFHPSFYLLHVSLIKPHLHIHTTTHIPQQPSKPKQHIPHLILQLFPASSLTHLDHFIPDFLDSQSKFTLVVPQASTILHSSTFLFFTASYHTHCDPFQFLDFTMWPKKRGLTLPLLRGAHFWWGQFEHSVTLRPVPRVQRLSRTSASLTLLPHWQVLVFGAAAAGGVCSSGWGSSSRCLFWPIVGVWVLIVDAFF